MTFFRKNKGLSVNKLAGFSLTELLIVVSIISALAVLAAPRFRKFQADARRAEAMTNLSTIHKLQTLHQQSQDNYVSWTKANLIGNVAGNTTRQCDFGVGATKSGQPGATGDGAHEMGFRPSGCENMRYGYWVYKKTTSSLDG